MGKSFDIFPNTENWLGFKNQLWAMQDSWCKGPPKKSLHACTFTHKKIKFHKMLTGQLTPSLLYNVNFCFELLKFSSQQFQNNGFSINPEHFTDVISTSIESLKKRKKKQADIETNTQQERDLFKNI